MDLRFTWDRKKAAQNLRKHGVSFETATQVFDDPHHLAGDNCICEDGEQRAQVIGMTEGLALMLVVFVDRSSGGKQTIRLISARKAVAYEKSIYEDQFE